jgi:hypothetical protein
MTDSIQPDDRSQFLKGCFARMRGFEKLRAQMDQEKANPDAYLEALHEHLSKRIHEDWVDYERRLPVLPLSICPFTRYVWQHSIDPYGLDGLWWNYEKPIRRREEPGGGLALCFTGAVRLRYPLEPAPFLCRPGPEAPYVIPRLLKNPDVKAVISTVKIGQHEGYLVVYYGRGLPPGCARPNDWGASYCRWRDASGISNWSAAEDNEKEWDFDLKPWLASGRLLWVAPGDPHFALRDEIYCCPYRRMSGRREGVSIRNGKTIRDEELAASAARGGGTRGAAAGS